ncbi:CDP-alcohol phosphatidyltransferase family protein [Bdellovibrio sp. PAP01]|uniref:CDP-alcohol phosphatidyltransferase family protein n=2 Tax=Bdellovibrio svalbardensis TaxID=2972972 RepID=A0ABT6DJS2_9BACT|nr:CDP-alcohol phosphatidyltransferase family protein [Bdellovibrio svalbardensis]
MTANHASLLGWLFVFLSTAALYFGLSKLDPGNLNSAWPLLAFPALVLLRLVFNALDGMIARANNAATPMGEVLNELGDIWGDTICYGILFFIPFVNAFHLALFLVCCWFAEFTGLLGRALPGHIRRQESVLGGKPERSLLFCVFAVICFFAPMTAMYINQFLLVLTVLTFLTGILRIYKIRKQTQGLSYQSHTLYGR